MPISGPIVRTEASFAASTARRARTIHRRALGSVPQGHVQLRYTLNNHSAFRDADVQAGVWFSTDKELDVRRAGEELQSADVRETFVPALTSKSVGQVFRVPDTAVEGQDYWVFVRAVPYDPETGSRLWSADADIWNNAILIRDKVTVSPGAC